MDRTPGNPDEPDDRVTALARAKLAEFQRVLGHENIMTLEEVQESQPEIHAKLLAEAAAELQPLAAAPGPLRPAASPLRSAARAGRRPRRAAAAAVVSSESLILKNIVVDGRCALVLNHGHGEEVYLVEYDDNRGVHEEVDLNSVKYTLQEELERDGDEENVDPKDLDSDDDDDDDDDASEPKAEDVLDSATTAAMRARLKEVQRMLKVPVRRTFTLKKLEASQPAIYALLLEETKATRRERRVSLLNTRVEVREVDLWEDSSGEGWVGGRVVRYRDTLKTHTIKVDSFRRNDWERAMEWDGGRVRAPLLEVTWKIQDRGEAPFIVEEKLPPPSEEETTFLDALRAHEDQQQKKKKRPAPSDLVVTRRRTSHARHAVDATSSL